MDEVVVSNEGGMEMEAKEAEMKMETQTEAEIERSKKKGDGDGGGSGSASAAAAAAAASSVVRWERFLPKMVLRVLLVEADDSTRQIIAALLRKCSYRVAAVSDGLKAWEVLKGRPHNIDLILTEVDLPSISGFALLTLIMEHEICKNIPVIMMSSQDSVSTVYKCMLRGAADFLVKPVRKNELRNLWQHVWRKQASTGGGHGPPDESVAQQKLEATAENNDVSNPSSGYMASDQRNRECIEKESDAQSSCTKPDMDSEGADVECMQRLSQPKRRKSLSSNINMQQKEEGLVASKDFQMQDADAAGSRAAAGANCCQAMTQLEDRNVDEHWRHGKSNVQTSESNHILANPSREAIDFIGAFDNYAKHMYRSSGSDVGANKIDSSRPFELSLRRSHPSGFVNLDTDDRHKLNHSDGSAFSRYVCRTFQPQQSTSRIACNQQKGYESSYDKQLTNHTPDYYSDTHAATANSQRHVSLATGQPGQAETTFTFPQQRVLPAPTPVRGTRFENLSNAYGPMVPLIFCMQSGPSPMQSPGSVGHQGASFQANTFHSLNQQARNSQQYNGLTDQITNDAIDQSENKQEHKVDKLENHRYFSSATDQSANSSFCNGNVSQLHSISYGSNGKVNPVIKVTSECGKEEASPTHGNSHQSMQREAALTKFRLKRKERCYGKKVRYESRKKLAEQRPRVKGQFVRQAHDEPPPGSL